MRLIGAKVAKRCEVGFFLRYNCEKIFILVHILADCMLLPPVRGECCGGVRIIAKLSDSLDTLFEHRNE